MLSAEDTPEAEARLQNLDQLLAEMTEYADENPDSTLATYLEEKSLLTSADENDSDGNAITLMTLHSAKGLEFPLVFVCGLEENLFPTGRAVDDPDPQAIEEERRLCYVGMTRAQEQLSLTYALRRYAYGSLLATEPSRFLSEVPAELTTQNYELDRGVDRSRQRVEAPPPRKKPPANPRRPLRVGRRAVARLRRVCRSRRLPRRWPMGAPPPMGARPDRQPRRAGRKDEALHPLWDADQTHRRRLRPARTCLSGPLPQRGPIFNFYSLSLFS